MTQRAVLITYKPGEGLDLLLDKNPVKYDPAVDFPTPLEPETCNGYYNIKMNTALDRFFKRMDAITTISNRPVGIPWWGPYNEIPNTKYI